MVDSVELRLGKPSELNRSREGCRAVALQSDAKADTLPVPPELLLASHVEGLLTQTPRQVASAAPAIFLLVVSEPGSEAERHPVGDVFTYRGANFD